MNGVAMLDIGAVAAFVRAAETGSFTAAAAELGLSASGVSKAVARLEARLGTRLMTRTTRRISLTPDGNAFYERCRQILADLQAAENALSDRRSRPRGRLRLSLPVGFARRWVLPALPGFLGRYPGLSVDLHITNRYSDGLEQGVDAVVRLGEVADSQVVTRQLTHSRFTLYAAPAYLERHGRPAHPDELPEHASVCYVWPGTQDVMPWQFLVDGAVRSFLPRGALRADQGEACIDLAVAGGGLMWTHDYMAEAEVRSGRLLPVLEDYALPPVPISLVYGYHRQQTPRMAALVEFLTEAVAAPARTEPPG